MCGAGSGAQPPEASFAAVVGLPGSGILSLQLHVTPSEKAVSLAAILIGIVPGLRGGYVSDGKPPQVGGSSPAVKAARCCSDAPIQTRKGESEDQVTIEDSPKVKLWIH